MSVVIDAASQRVTAKFPATPEGDRDLIAYLGSGRLPGDEAREETGTTEPPRDSEPIDPASTLRRLLRENRLQQRSERRRAEGRIADLKAQERDLLRLLEAAGRERPRGGAAR
jgi:hypothetical protein